jgi:hypothetical protein
VDSASIGVFTVRSGQINEDIEISDNTLEDMRARNLAAAEPNITIVVDPPNTNGHTFKRIKISGNKIYRTLASGPAIKVGTLNVSSPSAGTVFEDIEVSGNNIEYKGTASPTSLGAMFFASGPRTGFVFNRALILRNKLTYAQTQNGTHHGMQLRQLQHSEIAYNEMNVGNVTGIFGIVHGVNGGANLGNRIHHNTFKGQGTGIAFLFNRGSAGQNVMIENKAINAGKAYQIHSAQPTDEIRQD